MVPALLFLPLLAASLPVAPVARAHPAAPPPAAPPLMIADAGSAAVPSGAAPARRAHELWRGEDGLFYANAVVNGQPVRFLVDTGATTIVLTAADAARVGAAAVPAVRLVADTAAGRSVMSAVTLASVTVGPRSANAVRAAVAPGGLNVSLLGLTWLAALDSVVIEGDRMVLR